MLPNMSQVLKRWEQDVKLKTVSITTVDFEETKNITVEPKRMVVQVADKKKLNLDSLDWSKQYKWFHSRFNIQIGQYIEHKGIDYKLVAQGDDYSEYGYVAFAGEETLKTVLVAS